MISTVKTCLPQNDNIGRLADYTYGYDHSKGIFYAPRDKQRAKAGIDQPYFEGSRGVRKSSSGLRVRLLSECHLAKDRKIWHGIPSVLSDNTLDGGSANYTVRRNIYNDRCVNEKHLYSWIEGCTCNDDYEISRKEIIDTQKLNTRSNKTKSYHLIVSFRPEDQEKLTEEVFKVIEKKFAKVLGFENHQRVCGVHKNTEHLHLHVAYNMIDPKTHTRKEPFRDFWKRDQLCREIEKEYGLSVDNGRDPTKEKKHENQKAETIEAHTGTKSFVNWAKEHGKTIEEDLKEAKSWNDVHKALAKYGMEITPRGAGLVIKNHDGRQKAKASDVSPTLSFKKLKDRFGEFQKFSEPFPDPIETFGDIPIQKAPERDDLWKKFQEQRELLKQREAEIHAKYQRNYENGLIEIQSEYNRRKLKFYVKEYESIEKKKLRAEMGATWIDYLKIQAVKGNEDALALLRSKDAKFDLDASKVDAARYERFIEKRKMILNFDTTSSHKKKLLAVSTMTYSQNSDRYKFQIMSNGAIKYTFENGAVVVDDGISITFSEGAKDIAAKYVSCKWGGRIYDKDERTGEISILFGKDSMLNVGSGNTFSFESMEKLENGLPIKSAVRDAISQMEELRRKPVAKKPIGVPNMDLWNAYVARKQALPEIRAEIKKKWLEQRNRIKEMDTDAVTKKRLFMLAEQHEKLEHRASEMRFGLSWKEFVTQAALIGRKEAIDKFKAKGEAVPTRPQPEYAQRQAEMEAIKAKISALSDTAKPRNEIRVLMDGYAKEKAQEREARRDKPRVTEEFLQNAFGDVSILETAHEREAGKNGVAPKSQEDFYDKMALMYEEGHRPGNEERNMPLWDQYCEIRRSGTDANRATRERWGDNRKAIWASALDGGTKKRLSALSDQYELLEQQENRLKYSMTWDTFLQQKAQAGNQEALDTLAKKGLSVSAEPPDYIKEIRDGLKPIKARIAILADRNLKNADVRVTIDECRHSPNVDKNQSLGR